MSANMAAYTTCPLCMLSDPSLDAYSMLRHASLAGRFTRAGAVVMLLHDPSDIFLEGAKLCNMAGWELPTIILFALLLTTWGFLRLVVLPFWIIRSML